MLSKMKKIGRKISIIMVMFLCLQAFLIVTPPPAYAFPIFGAILQGIGSVACGIAQAVGNIVCGAVQIAGCALRGAAEIAANVVCGAVQIAECALRGAAEIAANVVCGAAQAAGCVIRGVAEVVGNVVCGAAQVAGCVVRGVAEVVGNVVCGAAQGIGNAVTCAGQGIQAALKWKAETCPFRQAYLSGTSCGLAYEIGRWVDNAYKSMGGTNTEVKQSDCTICNIAAGAMGVQPVCAEGAPQTSAPSTPPPLTPANPVVAANWVTDEDTEVTIKDILEALGIDLEAVTALLREKGISATLKELSAASGIGENPFDTLLAEPVGCPWIDEATAMLGPALMSLTIDNILAVTGTADLSLRALVKNIVLVLEIDSETLTGLLQTKGTSATFKELAAAAGISNETPDSLLAKINVSHPLINGIAGILGPAVMSSTIDNLLTSTGTAEVSISALLPLLEIDDTGINIDQALIDALSGMLDAAAMNSTIDELLASTGMPELSPGALLPVLGMDATAIDDLLAALDTEELPANEPVAMEQPPVTAPVVVVEAPAPVITEQPPVVPPVVSEPPVAEQLLVTTPVAAEEPTITDPAAAENTAAVRDGNISNAVPQEIQCVGYTVRQLKQQMEDKTEKNIPIIILYPSAGCDAVLLSGGCCQPGCRTPYGRMCRDAEIDTTAVPYPLAVFLDEGGYPRNNYFTIPLCQSLVKAGYIVALSLPPYIPGHYGYGPRSVEELRNKRSLDIKTVIDGMLQLNDCADDLLSGAIDPAAIGVLGRHYGARAAEQACGANAATADARVRAGVFLSPINAGLSAEDAAGIIVPTMTIFENPDHLCEAAPNRFVYDNAGTPKYCGVLENPYALPPLPPGWDRTCVVDPKTEKQVIAVEKAKAEYITAFFNRYLKDDAGADKILQTQDAAFVSYEYNLGLGDEPPAKEPSPAATVELGSKDFGKTVKATKGDVIRLTLLENYYEREQQGYQWAIVYFAKDILELEKVEHGAASIDKIDNTGGIKTVTQFYFKAVNTGNAMIIAGYHNAGKYTGVFFVNVDVLEPPEEKPEPDYAPNDVIIKFKAKATIEQIKNALAEAELTGEPLNEALSGIPCLAFLAHTKGIAEIKLLEVLDACVVTIATAGEDIPALCNLLALFPEVKYSQPNHLYHLDGTANMAIN